MKTLEGFYREYAAWLYKGAPDFKPFDRRYGLCKAITVYGLPAELIKKQLQAAGLSSIYPFGGGYTFERDYEGATAHLNAERREWVWEHCK